MLLPIFFVIFILSVLWAWYSMRDFELPKEVREVIKKLRAGRIKGVIVRFKKGFKHYQGQWRGRSEVEQVSNGNGKEEQISSF